jgi:hypothetical protein
VVDIKTAKLGLNLDENMLSLDPQLRRYAWVTGIRDVAFLWLIKARTDSFKKGDTVTLLEKGLEWGPGSQMLIVKYDADTEVAYVSDEETVRKMDEELGAISGKGSTEAKTKVFSTYVSAEKIAVMRREQITKTKIQFIPAQIPEEDIPEIGDAVGHEVVSIMDADKNNRWIKDGGVRFPNNQCVWCSYRGICTNNAALRDELLVQIGPAAKDDDWLSDLEEVE